MVYSEFFLKKSKHNTPNEDDYLCENCVIPRGYRFANLVRVDGKRICKYCLNYKKHVYLGEDAFIQDLNLKEDEKIAITVSGGKDSIYAWSQLVRILGPDRVVAINYSKIELDHPLAVENLKNASRILNSKLLVVKDDKAFDRFKRNLETFLANPTPEMVRVALCAGCRYGITELLHNAVYEKYGITRFVSAASFLELAPFKEELLEEAGDGNTEKAIRNYLALNEGFNFDNNVDIIIRDNSFKYKNNDSATNQIKSKYQLFDFDKYFHNNPEIIEKYVSENLMWKRPERSWHFDCQIETFKDFFYYGLLGYTETDFKISALVREGIITRKQGQIEIESIRYYLKTNILEDVKKLSRKLKIDYLIPKMEEFYKNSKFYK